MDPAGAGANNGCKQWVPSLCSVHLSAMRSGAASTWQAQAVSPTWTGLLCSRAPALKTRPSSCAVASVDPRNCNGQRCRPLGKNTIIPGKTMEHQKEQDRISTASTLRGSLHAVSGHLLFPFQSRPLSLPLATGPTNFKA